MWLSLYAPSEQPLSSLSDDDDLSESAFQDLLDDPSTARVFLVELYPTEET